MSIFNRKPKIIKGRSFNDYLNHYGKGYVNASNEVISDKKKLKPNKRYYEINGKFYQADHSRLIKNILITVGSLSLATSIYLPIHFTVIAPKERYIAYNFKYWNECESLNKLKTFVKETVTPGNKNYVPKVDRIATFDMDGTLFGERSPIYLEWMMYQDYCDHHFSETEMQQTTAHVVYGKDDEADVTLKETYDQITAFRGGEENSKLEMNEAYCGAVVFSNITIKEYIKYVENYLQYDAEKFNNLVYKDMFYRPMIEVVEFLQQNNFDVYIVSGTDRFMVRTIVNQHLNIPSNKVIGMDVSLYVDEATGEMKRGDQLKYKNVKKVKPELITQEIGKAPVLSFGNSSGDVDMHNLALANPNYKTLAFMNLADDNVRERGYSEAIIEERRNNWVSKGYQIFSMKDDWKTIYGDNVTLKQPE